MFKKSLSIVLAVLMVLSCMSAMLFTASATTTTPEGTGISDLSDIANDLTGKYYLTADIGSADELSEYQVPAGFTGTLDGNGNTIYTSVAVFTELGAGATIKNLTIDGTITHTFTANGNLGVLANKATGSGKLYLNNVTNKADVNYSVNSSSQLKLIYVGGFIGNVECAIEAVDCANEGAITATASGSANNHNLYIAGFIANFASAVAEDSAFVNCANRGTVEFGDLNAHRYAAGFVANVKLTSANADLIFENSTNYATVKSAAKKGNALFGGLIANSTSTNYSTIFKNCANYGDILAISSDAGNGGKAGGILGYHGAASNDVTFVGCYNKGQVVSSAQVGGIAGQIKSNKHTRFVACVNDGTVTHDTNKATQNFGGICGLIECSESIKASACVNNGAVTSTGTHVVGGIFGVAKVSSTEGLADIKYCVNNGALTGASGKVNAICKGDDWADNFCYDRTALDADVTVKYEGAQRSLPVDGETTFSIRFISEITGIENYKQTGVMVYVTEAGKSDIRYTTDVTSTVYTQIGQNVNGVNTAYPETVTEGKYYSALTVTNISVNGTYSFIVVPYTVDLEGVYAYADAYEITVTNGVLGASTMVASAAN